VKLFKEKENHFMHEKRIGGMDPLPRKRIFPQEKGTRSNGYGFMSAAINLEGEPRIRKKKKLPPPAAMIAGGEGKKAPAVLLRKRCVPKDQERRPVTRWSCCRGFSSRNIQKRGKEAEKKKAVPYSPAKEKRKTMGCKAAAEEKKKRASLGERIPTSSLAQGETREGR